MLAEKDKTMQDAGPTLKKLTADEEFQLLCEASNLQGDIIAAWV